MAVAIPLTVSLTQQVRIAYAKRNDVRPFVFETTLQRDKSIA
jgi:hypothetical protein